MNTESQNPKVKSCLACKRSLPYNFYGVRRRSTDGYNTCCKECRNFRRRQTYQRPVEVDEPILPLSEHNTKFLWSLPECTNSEDLIGLDLKRLRPVAIRYKKDYIAKGLSFHIKMLEGFEWSLIHGDDKSTLVECLVPILAQFQIRLFHSRDTVAQTNWGLIPNDPGMLQFDKLPLNK